MTRHDADEVVGRITTRGAWDRRHRVRYEELPDKPTESIGRQVVNIIALTLFVLVLFGSLIATAAILAVTYPQPGGFR